MSQTTAKKIQGANFSSMKGLGHFPASEDPQKFVSVPGSSLFARGCSRSLLRLMQMLPYRCHIFLRRLTGSRRLVNRDQMYIVTCRWCLLQISLGCAFHLQQGVRSYLAETKALASVCVAVSQVHAVVINLPKGTKCSFANSVAFIVFT